MLAAKKADRKSDISELKAQIDNRLYRLYGVTPDEIKIVEEAAPDVDVGKGYLI